MQACGNPRGSRHPRTGRVVRWENQFEALHGPAWKAVAQSREVWAARAQAFVRDRLGHCCHFVARRDDPSRWG
eukprot:1278595-Alexandrium_andersonii.AAC.1